MKRLSLAPVAVRMLASFRVASTDNSRSWSPVAPADDAAAPAAGASSPSSSTQQQQPEAERWWPNSQQPPVLGSLNAKAWLRNKDYKDGINATPIKDAPTPMEPPRLEDDTDLRHDLLSLNTVFEHERQFAAPPTFDPAIDDVDDVMHNDAQIAAEVNAAIDHDRKRLEAFANPISVEGQVEALLQPQRQDENNLQHRADFNGFSHWGLLHAAMIALEEQQDYKKAHQFVNRYMRDQDLFVQWLKHPKVVAHIDKKFGVDISDKYDKLMGLALSMYVRGKVQAFEGDVGGSLKSLTACTSLINEGGDLESNERHRKMLGAALAARGAVFIKLKSFERANEDFSKALGFVPTQRAASLFQMRAEAREQLGLIEDARRDEEHAAEIWERADVITPGMDGEPRKFVI